MRLSTLHNATLKTVLTTGIALVWFINGLWCKVLDFVPRHREIVARILGDAHAPMLTRIIGTLEILMAVWIMSRIKSRWCAATQIVVVFTMNILEFILVPDLLLFGRLNAVFAAIFIGVVALTAWVQPGPSNNPISS